MTQSHQTAKKNPSLSAIVTGAAGGLGRAIALRLAQAGWRTALVDVQLEGLRETAALVEQAGGTARVERLDVTQSDEWSALVERLRRDWPQLDLLVNNAGVCCSGDIGDFSLADWRWVIDVNLFGAIHGCHACRDWLVSNPRGAHVVNVASAAAIAQAPGMGAYNVSKAAVVALSETLYAELRPLGVGVTAVCPGFFATNLLAGGRFHAPDHRAAADRLMQRARISADDVARAVVLAVTRKPLYLMIPARVRIFWRLRRLCPTLTMRLVSWFVGRMRSAADTSVPVAPASAKVDAAAVNASTGPRPSAGAR
jgi:NAD(P)-dependent dehydrogenase (short-subunit alcohol dehydrogenase family)